MSRKSDAKKARRRKRLAGRDARWVPDATLGAADDHGLADEVAAAAQQFDDWVTSRGWLVDAENASDEVVSWVYPPSAADGAHDAPHDEGAAEPVTRVWIAILGNDDDFPERVGAVLVGGTEVYSLTPASFVERVEEFEAYRPGDSAPPP